MKKYEEAIKCYDKIILIDAICKDAHKEKGNSLRNLRRYSEAVKCYDKAIQIDPNYKEAYYNKGITLLEVE
jgi:tetratricopeptide (TPR) repeat protein